MIVHAVVIVKKAVSNPQDRLDGLGTKICALWLGLRQSNTGQRNQQEQR
jgi:hypothetical protein